MDTSKEYISMCQKAEEIQKKYKPMPGDFQANRILFKVTVYSGKYIFNKKKIWLPRQDQFQEMIISDEMSGYSGKALTSMLIFKIYGFSKQFYIEASWGLQQDAIWHPSSLEQLWLAFVMFEKCSKKFDGKNWIKE